MFIVHLPKSYPRLLDDLRQGAPPNVLLEQLCVITRSEWSRISDDAFKLYQDYIAGVYEGRIVSVYRITDRSWVGTHPVDRVVFKVVPAPELAFMIGRRCPGGPWKQGAARPIRYAVTSEVEKFYQDEYGVPTDAPESEEVLDARMLETMEKFARPQAVAVDSGTVLDRVVVEMNPRGGIMVTVPAGTNVLVVPEN